MVYFKRKDGSVFGKLEPTDEQKKAYVADGSIECDADGNALNKKSKKKNK